MSKEDGDERDRGDAATEALSAAGLDTFVEEAVEKIVDIWAAHGGAELNPEDIDDLHATLVDWFYYR